jgi:hypothetical protein
VSIPASADWYVTPDFDEVVTVGAGKVNGGPVMRPGVVPGGPPAGRVASVAAIRPGGPAAGRPGLVPPGGKPVPAPVGDAGEFKKELAVVLDELKKHGVPGLCIEEDEFNDDNLAALQVLPALQTLLLRKTEVTDAGLKSLADFPALRTLVLEGGNLTDAGVAHLAKVKNLKVLHLANVKITDQVFDSLQECTALESLLLMGCPEVTDKGLSKLASMEHLKAVRLMDVQRVSDIGLASLKNVKGLTTLQLEWCPEITD